MNSRGLDELIATDDPAWPLVREWLAAARNPVEVLATERARGESILLRLQVTTRSPLGAVALETGGILVDHGWLRFLGAGGERMRNNLLTWTGAEEGAIAEPLPGALVVAYDVVGGFFALNGGAFAGQPGNACYLAPDTLEWEDLGLSYSGLLQWGASGDLARFYEGMRWPGWEGEVAALGGDDGFSIYPFPWAREGGPIAGRSRRVVPMVELWNLQREVARQMQC